MQDNFQKIIFVISVVFFLFTLGVFVYSHLFLNRKLSDLENSQMAWQTEAVRREEIKVLDDTLKDLKPERADLETHFTRKSDVVPLLDTLESMATSVNAKASIASVEVSKDNSALVVSLRATGSFASVYKFLKLIENASYQIDIATADFRRLAGVSEGSVAQWDGIFILRVLSFIP